MSATRETTSLDPTNWARGGEQTPIRYRIRRCNGNRDCWMIVMLRGDGSEYDSYGTYTTSTSLDLLMKYAGSLTPNAGEHVDFVA